MVPLGLAQPLISQAPPLGSIGANWADPSILRILIVLKQKKLILRLAFFSDPAGIRTQDPYIKSVLLYQLSYGIVLLFRTVVPCLK